MLCTHAARATRLTPLGYNERGDEDCRYMLLELLALHSAKHDRPSVGCQTLPEGSCQSNDADAEGNIASPVNSHVICLNWILCDRDEITFSRFIP
jgi:hypothetical protein